MTSSDHIIKLNDSDVALAIENEQQRQEMHIELIASENYTSETVMATQGSVLTNKYAEGYPGKRYYGGCTYVDDIETLAIERAKALFGAQYANVQPHSGSQANAAVMSALLTPGDTILGMSLSDGGHLTHGSPVNFSGQIYHAVTYGINQAGCLDFDAIRATALKYQPKLIIAGFSAYSQTIDWHQFREIADEVGAYLMVDMAHIAGLVAAKLIPSPVGIADVITSTTHKTLRGPRGGLILANDNDVLNKAFNKAVFPGTQGGPLMHVIAAKAVAFKEAMSDDFVAYQKQVIANAQALASTLQSRGFDVISGGTENHMFLLSLLKQDLTGKAADAALGAVGITVNKNSIPNDPKSPFVTSGLRLGTPAVTTRGFKEEEMKQIGHWIADILDNMDNPDVIEQVQSAVKALCQRFPVYT